MCILDWSGPSEKELFEKPKRKRANSTNIARRKRFLEKISTKALRVGDLGGSV